jgi:hypothetical protein
MAGRGSRLSSRLLRYRRRVKRKRRHVKFYGSCRTATGETRGFGFYVKVSGKLSGKLMYKLITHTCNKLRHERTLPVHRKGESFPSFLTLFRSRWIRIRKLLEYHVKVKT